MDIRTQAITLLAKGIATSQVAAACGVSDSYISQIKADPLAQQKIAELQVEETVTDIKFDTTLERIESLALEKIEKTLPFANIRQAIEAFRVLNGAKKRNDTVIKQDSTAGLVVNLTLPTQTIVNFVTNQRNEIVEVDGKSMNTATVSKLDEIISSRSLDMQASLNDRKVDGLSARATQVLENLRIPERKKIPVLLRKEAEISKSGLVEEF